MAAIGGGSQPIWKQYLIPGTLGLWTPKGGRNGDTLIDLSGNNHDMTFVGTHTMTDDYVYIDGVNGGYGSINGVTMGPNITQEMVMCVSANERFGRLFAENKGLCFAINQNGTFCNWFYGWSNDGMIGTSQINTSFGEIASHSLILSYAELKMVYVKNGCRMNESEFNSNGSISGQTTFFNRTTLGRGITGKLMCVRIYDHALTDDELAQTHAADVALFGIP